MRNDMEEQIARIKFLGGQYNPDSSLSIDDQLWICESFTKELEQNSKVPNNNVSVNGNVNGTCKRSINPLLTETKLKAIGELKTFNYATPPIQIEQCLRTIFGNQNSKDEHWFYIARYWNPRAINRVIHQIIKSHDLGWTTIQNPAAYFTASLKYRKKRRSSKSI